MNDASPRREKTRKSNGEWNRYIPMLGGQTLKARFPMDFMGMGLPQKGLIQMNAADDVTCDLNVIKKTVILRFVRYDSQLRSLKAIC